MTAGQLKPGDSITGTEHARDGGRCCSADADAGWSCTRAPHGDNRHEAAGVGDIIATWSIGDHGEDVNLEEID